MKRTISLMILLAMLIGQKAWAEDVIIINNISYTYDTDAKTATVTNGQSYSDASLTIPPTITVEEIEYTVTSIGDNAFFECTVLESVTIPNTVTFIGDKAFGGCSSLTSVTMPFYSESEDETIRSTAFSGCTALKTLTLMGPCKVYDYEENEYVDQYVVTGRNVFYSGAFNGLTNIDLIIGDGIGDGITGIDNGAFADYAQIKSVTIPSSVTSIGKGAFARCTGVTDVYLYADPSELTWNISSDFAATGNSDLVTTVHVAAEDYNDFKDWLDNQENCEHIELAGDLNGNAPNYIAYTQGTDDGGKLEFYKDADCSEPIDITNGKSYAIGSSDLTNNIVYVKVQPDGTHTYNDVPFTVNKSISSIMIQAPRRRANLSMEEPLTVTAVNGKPGLYSFTMPNDGLNVNVTASFAEKPYLDGTTGREHIDYVIANGTTANTGSQNHARVYILDGKETTLGTANATTWYVCNTDLAYENPLKLYGNTHIILTNGSKMEVDDNFSGMDDNEKNHDLTIYGQSLPANITIPINPTNLQNIFQLIVLGTLSDFANLTINSGGILFAGQDDISADDITINGGIVLCEEGGISAGGGEGNITLGWNRPINGILANSYNGIVTAAKRFLVGPIAMMSKDKPSANFILPTGEVTDNNNLATQVLMPLDGYTVATNTSGLTFSGSTSTTSPFTITTGTGANQTTTYYEVYKSDDPVTFANTGNSIVQVTGTTFGAVENEPLQRTFTMPAEDVVLTVSDVSVSAGALTYNGSAQTPALTFNGTAVTANTDYTITGITAQDGYATTNDNAVNAGQYYLAITGKGQYVGSTSPYFSIAPKEVYTRELTITVKDADGNDFVYTGSALTPVVTVKDGETVIDGSEYSFTVTSEDGETTYYPSIDNNLIHAGTYRVNITDAMNTDYCTFEATGNYTIDPDNATPTPTEFSVGPKTLTITADANQTKTYGDADPTLTYTSEGLATGDVISGALSREAGENVIEEGYEITQGTLTAGDDYDIDFTSGVIFSITQKYLKITADNDTKLYDGTELTKNSYTHTDLAYDDIIDDVTITGSQTEVGESDNVPSDAVIKNKDGEAVTGNYNINYANGTLTVEDVSVKIHVVDTDDNGEALAGATVQVKTGNNVIDNGEWTSTTDTHTVSGLTVGVEYTIHETGAPTGYLISPDYTFAVSADGSITYSGTKDNGVLLVENKKTGDLEVSCKVTSDLATDANHGFIFTVTLNNTNISGTYGNMTFINGVATFALKGDESATTSLPTGISYYIEEANAEGFSISKNGYAGTISTTKSTAVFTNTRGTGDLKLECTLESDLATDANQEFTFTVTLGGTYISGTYGDITFANGVATVQLKGGESATATSLPTTLTYTITEADAEGFSISKNGDEGTISATLSTAKFTNTRKTGELTVTNTVLPATDETAFTFTVTLGDETISGTYGDMTFDNGEATIELKGGESATATGLPTTLHYTVTQASEDGYELVEQSNYEGNISTTTSTAQFKNVQLTEATVEIEWNDANDQDGIRPNSLTVTLSNGTEVTLNSNNSWTATVEGLPKYANGEEIVYTWTQGNLPEGYRLTETSVYGTVTTVTNTHEPEETEATVRKVWDDADNQDGKRPNLLTVALSDDISVALSPMNNWTATVEHLPKYANGEKIEYTWTEVDLPEGYELTDTSVDGTVTTLTNTHTPEETGATVKIVWDDNNNTEGFRPESVTVKLLADGEEAGTTTLNADNDWQYTWTDLPKYASGQEIEYTVSQSQLTNYKTPSIMEDSETEWSYTVTNSRDLEQTDVKVTKVWDDNDNAEGFRPESVTINLMKGSEKLGSIALNQSNNWTYTWTQKQKYENGQAINYTVTEDPVSNYTTNITKATDGTFTYTVTNSLNPVLYAKNTTNTWITWCDKNEYTIPEGCKVYTISSITGTTVNLSNALTTIPAYTPVLINRTAGELSASIIAAYKATGTAPETAPIVSDGNDSFTFYGNAGITPFTDNGETKLIYVYGNTDGKQSYILRSGDFIVVDNKDNGISTHRCWLTVSTGTNARMLTIGDTPTITEVNEVIGVKEVNDDSWYDLQGRKLSSKPSRAGIYIVNGKKIMVK